MIELKFCNTVFRFRFDFFAAVAVLILFYEERIALWGLYACILHESGHLLAMFAADVPVRSVTLYGAGIRIDTKNNRRFLNPAKDIFILVSGVAVNFAVCAYTILFDDVYIRLFGVINLVVGLFNLLPLSMFDGGRIISALISAFSSPERAERLLSFRQKTDFIIIPLSAVVFFILGNRNITLYVTLIYFWIVTAAYYGKEIS